jgi:hypothetical protein
MIITSVQAQYDNLGDAVIRSTLVRWLAGIAESAEDQVVAVTGDAPREYLEVMDLPERVQQVTSVRDALVLNRARRLDLVFAPGEQALDAGAREWPKTLANLALSSIVRLRGGTVSKVGRGYRGDGGVLSAIERAQTAVSNVTWVRDVGAVDRFPRTKLMPDIALASAQLGPAPGYPTRGGIAVSLRSDRSHNLGGLKAALGVAARRITVCAQVERDLGCTTELAAWLGADDLGWASTMARQLAAVNSLYTSSDLVVSDRLHVLLFALRAGAVPVGIETGAHSKLSRQLTALGLGHLVTSYDGVDGLLGRLRENLEAERANCVAAVSAAEARLERVQRDLATLILGSRRRA